MIIKREALYVFLLAVVQFIHIVDFVVMMPLGPMLMDELSLNPAQFGQLVSAYTFSAAISALALSPIADRYPRKNLLLLMLLGFILGTIFCGLSQNFSQLLLSRIVAGCFGGLLNTIVYSMVTDLVPYERRGKAMGILVSAFSAASILGIPLGLMLADSFSWQYSFYGIALFSVFVLFACWRIFPLIPILRTPSPWSRVLIESYELMKVPLYLKAYGFIFLVAVSVFLVIPFLAPYAVKNMGIANSELKYMYLLGGLVTLFSGRYLGILTDRHGALKVFQWAVLISSIPVVLFTQAGETSLVYYLVLSTFFMVFVSGRMIPCMTLVSEVPRPADRGAFMGILNAIRSIGSGVATVIAGMMMTEDSDLKILGFDYVGYLSLFVIFLTMIYAYRLSLSMKCVAPILQETVSD